MRRTPRLTTTTTTATTHNISARPTTAKRRGRSYERRRREEEDEKKKKKASLRWGNRVRVQATSSSESSTQGKGKDNDTNDTSRKWKVKYFYDGDCPVRGPERKTLEQLDGGRGAICFVDLSLAPYDAEEHQGVEWKDAMRQPTAINASGEVIKGVKVFRALYDAVGLGFVWNLAELPVIERVVSGVYDFWSENRFQITGRKPLEELALEREQEQERE